MFNKKERDTELTLICTQDVSKYLPDFQTQKIKTKLKCPDEVLPFWGLQLGKIYENTGVKESYLVADEGKPFNESVVGRMYQDGLLLRGPARYVVDRTTGQDKGMASPLILLYKNPDAKCFLPTKPGLLRACNIASHFVYEISLCDNDGWRSYIYVEVKTKGMFAMNMLDYLENDLHDIFESAESFVEHMPDAEYDKENNTMRVPFCDELGTFDLLEFDANCMGDLRDMVNSIRIISQESEICKEVEM